MEYLNLHSWEVTTEEAREIQFELAKKILLKDIGQKFEIVAGADVSYSLNGKIAYGAVVVLALLDLTLIEKVRIEKGVKFPYIPGLLTFREGPALLEAFSKIKNEPDIILFDGQGIAHPSRMGLATHMGIILNKPSIGCAKTHLWGKIEGEISREKGSYTLIKEENDELLGVLLRTRNKVKPVFVSPGYKITLDNAIKIILQLCPRFRIPQPLRLAHTLSKKGSID